MQKKTSPRTGAQQHQTNTAIGAYVPRRLDDRRWELSADACRAAVALAGANANSSVALLSSLTRFLASPAWDGRTAPDLFALLTEANIVAFTDQLPPSANKSIPASNLRRIAKAVAADRGTPAPVRPRAKHRYPSVLLVEGAMRPIPAAHLFGAWMVHTGNTMNANPMEPVLAHWRRTGQVTAAPESPSTLGPSSSAWALTEVKLRPEKASMNLRTTQGSTSPVKKMSRRAAIEHAKKARAAAAAASTQQPVEDVDSVPETVRCAVEKFLPRGERAEVWQANEALAHRLVYGHRPPSVNNARTLCSYVARYLHWYAGSAHRADGHTGLVIDVEEVRDLGLVEHFVFEVPMPEAAVGTTRSALRRAVASLDPKTRPRRPVPQNTLAPYNALECSRYIAVALHQPTPIATSNLCFIVGLGLGAGLSAAEIKSLNRTNICSTTLETGQSIMVVKLTKADRPRVVPVRNELIHVLDRALELHRQQGRSATAPLIGKATGKNPVGSAIDRAVIADGSPLDLDVRRLRNTWLVSAMCAPVPLADLMRTAGLRSSRTFANLLPFCPDSDRSSVDAVLAQMSDVLDGPLPAYARTGKADR